MKQLNLEFKQNGQVWETEPVQMLTPNMAVEYKLSASGTINIQRSSTANKWYDVPDVELTNTSGMFNICGGVNGLWIRFFSNVKIDYISVTL